MKNLLFIIITLASFSFLNAQENIIWTNAAIGDILKGDFDPSMYAAGVVIDDPSVISAELEARMDEQRLKTYLEEMSLFENRNTGSDTLSLTFGIGAARNWALDMFESFSEAEGGRMQVGFLQFDQEICAKGGNATLAVEVTVAGPQYAESVFVDAKSASRCDTAFDPRDLAYR